MMRTAPSAPMTASSPLGQARFRSDLRFLQDIARYPVGLPGHHRELGDRGLGVGVERHRPMMPPPPARCRGGARHVDEGHQWHVEDVTGPDEPRRLDGGVDVQAPRQHAGLVPNDPDGLATQLAKPVMMFSA